MVLLLFAVAAALGAAHAKDTAFVEVVLFESSPNGDYTTYTTGLQGRFSKAGATISAEGEIVQVGAKCCLFFRGMSGERWLRPSTLLFKLFFPREFGGGGGLTTVCVCVCVRVCRPRASKCVRERMVNSAREHMRSQQDGSYLVEFNHGENMLSQVILLTSGPHSNSPPTPGPPHLH